KRGSSKNRMSSIGCSMRSSHLMNAARNTSPAAKPAMMPPLPHPSDGPSMIAHSSDINVTTESTAPTGSRGRGSGSLDSGTSRRPDDEHDEADGEEPVPAEAVTEAAVGQQQTREHDDVAVDDPLQLAGAGAEPTLAHAMRQRRDGDVEDVVVDADHDQREAQDE